MELINIYTKISFWGYAIGVFLLIVTIFYFFRFNIIELISDLNGSKAKKEIEAFKNNKLIINKTKSNPYLNESFSVNKNIMGAYIEVDKVTNLNVNINEDETTLLGDYEETVVLCNYNETEKLK